MERHTKLKQIMKEDISKHSPSCFVMFRWTPCRSRLLRIVTSFYWLDFEVLQSLGL